MARQHTIAEKVACRGLGLHSGLSVELTLCPARADTGIVFVRRDRAPNREIPAWPASVASTSHATTLADPEDHTAAVRTVEHLLAALWALGIDNVRIEVDGSEVPALDGSAAPFVELIRSAGVFAQHDARAVLELRRSLEVVDGESWIRIEPSNDFHLSYGIDFEHRAIGRQQLELRSLNAELFVRELASARTFGFLSEVSTLVKSGFARGGSLENTVVLNGEGVLNEGGLRWSDEFVRHKMLDLIGDLSLLGVPIRGHVRVERGGHTLHQRLVQEILVNRDAWQLLGGDGGALRALESKPQRCGV